MPSTTFPATILDPDGTTTLVRANVTMWRDSRGQWAGIFSVPLDAPISKGGVYRLQADDGRSGEIVVAKVVARPGGQTISFEVSGLFK
jgi:hypothetical protein